MVFIEGCENPKAVAILIRGGTEDVIEEAERSIRDALCVVREVVEEPKIVYGGGATEVEVAMLLKKYAKNIPGKEQLVVNRFAEALEAISAILSENSGLDPIIVLTELRSRHERGEVWAGIDVNKGKVNNMEKLKIFEPLSVKKQIIKSATEAATAILKIDDLISAAKLKIPKKPPGPTPPGLPP